MKKYLILLILLTGCVQNEDFSKTCTSINKTNHLEDKTIINITYDNKDKVKEAIVTKNYKSLDKEGNNIITDIKKASETYNKKYSGKNIKVTMSKDSDGEYELKYYLDVASLDDETVKEFNLRKNSVRFFNKMREVNIECEG